MAQFNAEKYKEKLQSSLSINDCEKVPVPRLKNDQNYVFISYSHRDYRKVYQDLADLYESGISFWYDHGLPAGENWDDVVRRRLSDPRCSGVIFYLSENLFLSESIQTEIRIVRGKDENPASPDHPLNYFCVNLTNQMPSGILLDSFRKKQFEGSEDLTPVLSTWKEYLETAFTDRATYLPFSAISHKMELIEQIGIRFNITPNINPYEFCTARFILGNGTIEFENKSLYTGYFREGLFDGSGVMHYGTGEVYDGEWKAGKRHGEGRITYPDGTTYTGGWKKGMRDGVGSYRDSARYYVGEWKQDRHSGTGSCTYFGKMVYHGQWKKGKFDGLGTMLWTSGAEYTGQWMDNERCGEGICRWPDGSIYYGQWKNDKRSGNGAMCLSNGSIYYGQWKNDKRKGNGKLCYPDGRSCSGIWNDTILLQGKGVLCYPDGSFYDGEIRNNLRHGRGVYTRTDGTVLSGTFRKDVFVEE